MPQGSAHRGRKGVVPIAIHEVAEPLANHRRDPGSALSRVGCGRCPGEDLDLDLGKRRAVAERDAFLLDPLQETPDLGLGETEGAYVDLVRVTDAPADAGTHRLQEHRLHLSGDAREKEASRVADGDLETWRRPFVVREHRRPLGEVRLLGVALEELATP